MNGWEHETGVFLLLVLEVISAIAVVIVPILAAKALGLLKMKSNTELNALLTSLVKKGVNYAEAWAKKQAEKPAGDTKLQKAVDFVLAQLKAYKVPEIAAEKIVELIEGQLRRDKDAGEDSSGPDLTVREGSGGGDQ